MVELFLLGCTGIVVFLHGANFFFHALTQHLTIRSLRDETDDCLSTLRKVMVACTCSHHDDDDFVNIFLY
ncbi:hypothetical protein PanWU01x14_317000 [Parasponia andersonii]|uniref:Uncharacterized protein n=1 Tax=Parasponia andersonii TaxID=3476 RepID=A0A2P5AMV0_PARAD|nr:hypothetical protein PanWU01x14_317000 [Parasponia andersonii]